MKNKNLNLDMDFIGGERPLTKEEEKSITAYLQAKKTTKTTNKKSLLSSRKKQKSFA